VAFRVLEGVRGGEGTLARTNTVCCTVTRLGAMTGHPQGRDAAELLKWLNC
jgi:hypothetical protein